MNSLQTFKIYFGSCVFKKIFLKFFGFGENNTVFLNTLKQYGRK